MTTCEGLYASGRAAWLKWVFKFGYPELVRDDSYTGRLQDGDPNALAIFEREVAQGHA